MAKGVAPVGGEQGARIRHAAGRRFLPLRKRRRARLDAFPHLRTGVTADRRFGCPLVGVVEAGVLEGEARQDGVQSGRVGMESRDQCRSSRSRCRVIAS